MNEWVEVEKGEPEMCHLPRSNRWQRCAPGRFSWLIRVWQRTVALTRPILQAFCAPTRVGQWLTDWGCWLNARHLVLRQCLYHGLREPEESDESHKRREHQQNSFWWIRRRRREPQVDRGRKWQTRWSNQYLNKIGLIERWRIWVWADEHGSKTLQSCGTRWFRWFQLCRRPGSNATRDDAIDLLHLDRSHPRHKRSAKLVCRTAETSSMTGWWIESAGQWH